MIRARLSVLDTLAVGTVGLRARRLRSVLAALGIAIGIATVVLVTSIPASSQADLDRRLSALGADLLRADPVQSGDEVRTLPTESQAMLERVGPVTGAAVVANTHAQVRSSALRSQGDGAITALAVSGSLDELLRLRVADGRALDGDVEPTVVLGSDAAERLGLDRLPSAPVTIDIGGVAFTVVGVLAPSPLAVDLQSAVLMDWEDAEAWLDPDVRPTVAYVAAPVETIGELRPVLASTLSPESPGRVLVSRPSDVIAAKQASGATFAGMSVGLAGVALLVGGVGIANTLFASVLERRREIGLRRALGAQRASIRTQFMTEALCLCLAGGALGSAGGAVVTVVWATSRGWPVVIPLGVVCVGIAAALVTGVLAGIAPSVRAARLAPTLALSAE
ncbi:ABC transporter permease [Sanguibacter sp. Leaf3]|uniref:ABC transporter permease n=1 Tax=Sanguibacter sp. Leaf3 TaxID=1736209 RepID=UPI0006FC4592|nr:ABC transporter permease [Sanguibacter sp. Leaf3]KQT97860.1 peptide ABC transporter permease [Sanguibacter sp. Leaf3]